MATTSTRWRRIGVGLAVGLALAVVGAVLALDTLLTSRARAAAADLSVTLGRPVQVGRVSVSLLHGLAVQVTDVSVGAGPGEPRPLAQVALLEVRVDVLRALLTLGHEVPVRSALAEGLSVTVLALPDGTTNLERVLDALDSAATPSSPATPTDLSAVQVDHLELASGHIALVDLRKGAGPDVEVKALRVTVENLAAGKPLEVTLTAAALAPTTNLEVHLLAGPLPATLVPVPERLTLKLQPLDLAPLAPFFPRSLGLQAGRLDADLEVAPGAAVPGGTGPTRLKGVLHALGLRFAQAPEARTLDVSLDADASADLTAGDVTLTRLDLALGPAKVSGHGRLIGLLGATPGAEAFSLTASELDPSVLVASFPALRRLLPGEVAGPVGLHLTADGTQARPTVAYQLDLTPVRLTIPEQLTKAAGAPMSLTGTVRGVGGGTLAITARADLSGADLRPGGTLDKAPGAPLRLSLAGSVHPAAPFKLALSAFEAQVLGDALTGTATAERPTPGTLHVSLGLRATRLDLDRLLLHADPPPPASAQARSSLYAGVSGRVDVELGSVRTGGVEATRLAAAVTLADGKATVEKCTFTAAGGAFVADGSTFTLDEPTRPFVARIALQHLDVREGLKLAWSQPFVSGALDGKVELRGALRSLTRTVTGQLDGLLRDGTLVGVDLAGMALGPLLGKLPFMQGVARQARAATTALGTVPVGLTLDQGIALLKAPLTFQTAEAGFAVSGGVGFDGSLRLPTRVELSPALLASATGGRLKVRAPVPVAFTLSGLAWRPEVSGLDVGPTAAALLTSMSGGALQQAVGGALPGVGGQLLGGVGQLLGGRAGPASPDAGTRLEDQAVKALEGLFGR